MISHPLALISLGLFGLIGGAAAFVGAARFGGSNGRSPAPAFALGALCAFAIGVIFALGDWQ